MAKQHSTGERHWYAIHTYAGYEEKVVDSIQQRISTVDMADKIFDVLVPKEKQIEIKNGNHHFIDEIGSKNPQKITVF